MSIKNKLISIAVGNAVILAVLICITSIAMDALTTATAYVHGESLWSKSQKDAVRYLTLFVETNNPEFFTRYTERLVNPNSNKAARLELEKPDPDKKKAFESFLLAGNHRDDINGMIDLFVYGRGFSYLSEVIDVWREADQGFQELQDLGSDILRQSLERDLTVLEKNDALLQIEALNTRLTILEERFSSKLGSAARWLKQTLLTATISISLALMILSVLYCQHISQSVVKKLDALHQGVARMAAEDFGYLISVKVKVDELDSLAQSFNSMSIKLDELHTERKLFLLSIEDKAQQLAEAQRMSRVGNWQWQPKTGHFIASDEFLNITELGTHKSLDIHSFLGQIHADDRHLVENSLRVAAHGIKNFALDCRIAAKGGNIKYVHLTCRRNEGPNVGDSLVGVLQDVTDMHNLQTQLFHSSQMASLGEMAGGVAHEINNPLAIIHARARHIRKVLTKEPPEVAKALDFAEIVEKTADRIANIVTGLRSLSRNTSEDSMRICNAKTAINDALTLCQEKFFQHEVGLEILLPADFEFLGRSTQISQVIVNLLNNAFDAVQHLSEKWVRLAAIEKEDALEISVTDSGSGIPADILSKIMLPFFTTKDIGKGTGLGLSISKGIVDAHRGKFEVDVECKNTRFVVVLPRAAPPKAETQIGEESKHVA